MTRPDLHASRPRRVPAAAAGGGNGHTPLPVDLALCGVLVPNVALWLPLGGVWLRLAVAAVVLGAIAAARLRRAGAVVQRPSFDSVLLGLVGTAILYDLTWLGMRLPAIAAEAGIVFGLARESGNLLGAVLSAGVVGEEVFWRGALLPALAVRWPAPVACVVAAALAALGFLAAPTWLLPVAVFGTSLVWNALLLYAGDLTAPLVSHFTWDFLVLVLVPLL